MDKFYKILGLAVAGIIIIVIIGLLFSLPIMLLWNACLVPAIPAIAEIGWLQAWGINILFALLFARPTTSNK